MREPRGDRRTAAEPGGSALARPAAAAEARVGRQRQAAADARLGRGRRRGGLDGGLGGAGEHLASRCGPQPGRICLGHERAPGERGRHVAPDGWGGEGGRDGPLRAVRVLGGDRQPRRGCRGGGLVGRRDDGLVDGGGRRGLRPGRLGDDVDAGRFGGDGRDRLGLGFGCDRRPGSGSAATAGTASGSGAAAAARGGSTCGRAGRAPRLRRRAREGGGKAESASSARLRSLGGDGRVLGCSHRPPARRRRRRPRRRWRRRSSRALARRRAQAPARLGHGRERQVLVDEQGVRGRVR